MIKNGFAVTFEQNSESAPQIMSTHRTMAGAERAFRRRNPHLFRKIRGAEDTGTFDHIRPITDGELGERSK